MAIDVSVFGPASHWANDLDSATAKRAVKALEYALTLDSYFGWKAAALVCQERLYGKHPRCSDQAGDKWAGFIVAEVLGLDPQIDRKRIKSIIGAWLASGALVKVKIKDANRQERPCLEVGEWAIA